MRHWQNDLWYAVRTLSRNPGFTTVAVLILALGIGINTAVYSLARGTLFAPLPFPEADRLGVVVSTLVDRSWEYSSVSIPEMRDVEERSSSFAGITIFESRRSPTLGGEVPERPLNNFVTASYFDVLKAKALLGRTFLPEEDQGIGGHPFAVLSHELWQRRFGGDPAIVGSKVVLSDQPYTVIGVMPAGFRDMRRDLEQSEMWLPLTMGVPFYGQDMFESRSGRQYLGLARLRDGVGFAAAQADLDRISRQLQKEQPYAHEGRGLRLVPLREWFYSDMKRPLKALSAGAFFVLLICCANLSMLLLVRGRTRQLEIAVRAALGADRTRLAQQTLAEGLLLALLGGGLGLLLAWWATRFWALGFGLPVFAEIGLEPGVLGVSLGAILVTGLILGLLPALRIYTAPLQDVLRTSGRSLAGGGRPRRGPNLIVVGETGLALMLLVGAGLTAKSLYRLVQIDLGYDSRDMLTVQLELRGQRYDDDEAVKSFTEQLSERIQAVPGVRSAVLWGPSMLGEAGFHIRLSPEGMDPADPNGRVMTQRLHVSPGALKKLGITLLRGREFTRMDRQPSPPLLAIFDQRLAQSFWPGEDAVGKRFYTGENPDRYGIVIGVALNVRHRGRLVAENEVAGDVYISNLQIPVRTLSLLVHCEGDVAGVLARMRKSVAELDQNLVLFDSAMMEDRLAEREASPRFTAALMAIYAGLAILLASLGIYGVLAYSVQQRAPELAMRSALGALPQRQLLMVIRQGMASVLLGVVLGLAGAYVLSRSIESLLFDVSRTDPAMYLAVTALLILVSLAACYLPARRASRVDPMLVLRGG